MAQQTLSDLMDRGTVCLHEDNLSIWGRTVPVICKTFNILGFCHCILIATVAAPPNPYPSDNPKAPTHFPTPRRESRSNFEVKE